jgi:hypothetical protein
LTKRFILPALLHITLIGVCFAPARAAIFGPDMPAWNQALAADDSRERSDDSETADPLTPIRASLTEAQELAQSGHAPEALSKAEGALRQLDDMTPTLPGVSSLREGLEEVRDKAARQKDEEAKEAREKTEKEADHPNPLDGIQTERNERVEKWLHYYTGRGRERFQI